MKRDGSLKEGSFLQGSGSDGSVDFVTNPGDRGLRPLLLSEFLGQASLREKLSVAIQAACKRKEPVDHILFSGPPGLGKTTLAGIIASEMNSSFHSTSAPALGKPGDLVKILTLLEDGDVLFIDEIHRLSTTCEEVLYSAMEDGSIDFILGEGATARSIKLPLHPFTLVGATTRSGNLSAPLKARFGLDLKIDFYDQQSLAAIVERNAPRLELEISAEAALLIAGRCRMTPREAIRLTRRIRDYATVAGSVHIDEDFTADCLEKMHVDELGLNELDRRILSLMIERYNGGPVGLKTIAALVNELERTVEEDHEPFMLRMGLVEKTPQGRIVTERGFSHMGFEYSATSQGLAASFGAGFPGKDGQEELF